MTKKTTPLFEKTIHDARRAEQHEYIYQSRQNFPTALLLQQVLLYTSVVDCRSSSELLLYRSRSCSSRRALPHLLEKVCAPSQTLKLVIKISENLKVVNQKIQKLGAVQSSNVGCQCDSLFSLSKIRNRRISGPVLMDP